MGTGGTIRSARVRRIRDGRTATFLVACAWLSWPASASAQDPVAGGGTDPAERFREAENTFRFQDYAAAEAALNALLHPEVLLTNPDDVLKAREYLGACYYWLGNEKRMEEEFTALLILAPNHRLDPFYYPADLIEKMDRLRARLAELHVIDLERRERSRDEKPPCVVPKETVVRRSRWVSFIPFGIGQFHNGDTVKGALFLTGETLALGANVGAYVAAERLKGADGFYSASDARTARNLRVVQYASLGVLAGLVIWGVMDAALHVRTEERSVEMVPCPAVPPPGGGEDPGGHESSRFGLSGMRGPALASSPVASFCIRVGWFSADRISSTGR